MMEIIFSEQGEPGGQQEASGQVHLPAGLAWSSPVSRPEERLQPLSGNSSQNRSPVPVHFKMREATLANPTVPQSVSPLDVDIYIDQKRHLF